MKICYCQHDRALRAEQNRSHKNPTCDNRRIYAHTMRSDGPITLSFLGIFIQT